MLYGQTSVHFVWYCHYTALVLIYYQLVKLRELCQLQIYYCFWFLLSICITHRYYVSTYSLTVWSSIDLLPPVFHSFSLFALHTCSIFHRFLFHNKPHSKHPKNQTTFRASVSPSTQRQYHTLFQQPQPKPAKPHQRDKPGEDRKTQAETVNEGKGYRSIGASWNETIQHFSHLHLHNKIKQQSHTVTTAQTIGNRAKQKHKNTRKGPTNQSNRHTLHVRNPTKILTFTEQRPRTESVSSRSNVLFDTHHQLSVTTQTKLLSPAATHWQQARTRADTEMIYRYSLLRSKETSSQHPFTLNTTNITSANQPRMKKRRSVSGARK
ncbi:uncharacterized protein LY89DRAFT_303080 [Mollisia scopiformis]|uniref:Uncharacterized protein n=1 Tax=Mollisia scopiformis TaxID=149040 RepID=A0A194XS38_MOLSC|nr:uncharacterized protein LY89DRAFT_303080 [Mollisia scopiformis]KUJ22542.1 hypothetical protein LY89DRAFT_303080 [Mollisia scopiformis]